MYYSKKEKSYVPLLILLAALLCCAVVLAVCVGKYPVSPSETLRVIFCSVFSRDSGLPEMTENVVLRLRIPRILASVLVGAALSSAGCAYQGIFKNPLVSPDFLGVSSGACIGAALAILLGLSSVWISLFAFVCGILAVLLTMSIPALVRNRSNIMLVLAGIIVGSAMSSILGFLKYAADPDSQLATITYWTMGNFGYVQADKLLPLLFVTIPPLVLLMLMSWWIDVLSMGESEARALGANVRLVRGLVILCSTLLTAGSVCISGTISWVGLIVPHFCRILVGPGSRKLLPVSSILGGLFMLLVDTLSRVMGVSEMPVSIMTGLIGAPVFCWLLWRQRGAPT